jgi:hypothetical protein
MELPAQPDYGGDAHNSSDKDVACRVHQTQKTVVHSQDLQCNCDVGAVVIGNFRDKRPVIEGI